MLRRNFFDTFMNDFFDERDRYFGTISDRMNSLYSDLDNTYRSILDTDVMEEEQPVQTIKHFESQNKRIYTDDKGRKHWYERRIENLPNEDNKFKIITTKRIIPKGKSLEDVKSLPDSKKKKSLKDAKEDDFVETVSEEVMEGLPETHLEMLDNWYGRNLLGDQIQSKAIEGKGKVSEKPIKKQGDKLLEKDKSKQQGGLEKSKENLEVEKKKQIENLKKEFDEQFKEIHNQFQSMKKNIFERLDNEANLSKESKV